MMVTSPFFVHSRRGYPSLTEAHPQPKTTALDDLAVLGPYNIFSGASWCRLCGRGHTGQVRDQGERHQSRHHSNAPPVMSPRLWAKSSAPATQPHSSTRKISCAVTTRPCEESAIARSSA